MFVPFSAAVARKVPQGFHSWHVQGYGEAGNVLTASIVSHMERNQNAITILRASGRSGRTNRGDQLAIQEY